MQLQSINQLDFRLQFTMPDRKQKPAPLTKDKLERDLEGTVDQNTLPVIQCYPLLPYPVSPLFWGFVEEAQKL